MCLYFRGHSRVQLKNSSNFISNATKKSSFEINDNVISFNEEPLKLTKTEFEILSFLIKYKNQIVKREKLLDFLSSIIQSDRSLDYHIKNIRYYVALAQEKISKIY